MGMTVRMRWPEGKLLSFTMSYDDGRTEDRRLAALMRRYGVKGTFNVNTGLYCPEDRPDTESGLPHRKMRRSEMIDFVNEYRDIVEIAAHGRGHKNFATLSVPQIIDEIISDRIAIEEDFGTVCRGAAYPYGAVSDDAVKALGACGISFGRSTVSTGRFDLPENWLRLDPTCHHNDGELFRLLDEFLAERECFSLEPRLFYLWGHSYEFDDNGNWDRIERFLSEVGGNPKVWYATNIGIFDYVAAFKNLVWSARGTRVFNPGCIPVFFYVYKGSWDCGIICKADPGETLEIG